MVAQWRGNSDYLRVFSKPSEPEFFNYQDYQRVCLNTFLIQNELPSFMDVLFSIKVLINLAFLLLQLVELFWPNYQDPYPLTFPKILHSPKEISNFPQILFLFSEFALTQIVQQDYTIIKDASTIFSFLGRTFKKKMVDDLQNKYPSVQEVQEYLQNHPSKTQPQKICLNFFSRSNKFKLNQLQLR